LHGLPQDARQDESNSEKEESDDNPDNQIRQDVEESPDPIIETLIERAPGFVHADREELPPRCVRRSYNRQVARRVPMAALRRSNEKGAPVGAFKLHRRRS
jgi:hypothetical protein